jgi:hypothetical protein
LDVARCRGGHRVSLLGAYRAAPILLMFESQGPHLQYPPATRRADERALYRWASRKFFGQGVKRAFLV